MSLARTDTGAEAPRLDGRHCAVDTALEVVLAEELNQACKTAHLMSAIYSTPEKRPKAQDTHLL